MSPSAIFAPTRSLITRTQLVQFIFNYSQFILIVPSLSFVLSPAVIKPCTCGLLVTHTLKVRIYSLKSFCLCARVCKRVMCPILH